MIFQNPLSALDPVYTIGDQIVEIIRIHEKISKKKPMKRLFFVKAGKNPFTGGEDPTISSRIVWRYAAKSYDRHCIGM